jgi:hypothetical protein
MEEMMKNETLMQEYAKIGEQATPHPRAPSSQYNYDVLGHELLYRRRHHLHLFAHGKALRRVSGQVMKAMGGGGGPNLGGGGLPGSSPSSLLGGVCCLCSLWNGPCAKQQYR